MKPKRITIKDIAQRAGVATGTVSLVLRDRPRVAEATRKHVKQVIRELGYIYDRGAGQLRSKQSNLVGVSICDLANPYFAETTAGIQAAVEASGRVLVLGNCAESPPRQFRFLDTLRQYNVEGLLVTPAIGTSRESLAALLNWGIPLVQVTRYVPGVATDFVGNDNRLGTKLVTQHLVGLGHRQFGYIGLKRQTTTSRDRFAGFQAALKDAHVPLVDDWIVECPATREAGFNAIARLFTHGKSPSALVCFNDLVAFGAMLGLRQMGLEPGRDCSVVGADDVAEAVLWQPPLTTVAVDVERIGREAARLLVERIKEPNRPLERVVVEPRLIVRASCATPNPAVAVASRVL
ncbi:MAG: LacI family DNA-binding transcriptional regulator [Burkholderiales bacterium]|nr:LacI family DNA-binding transcriptional regulator [Burkholderiales bacterium]